MSPLHSEELLILVVEQLLSSIKKFHSHSQSLCCNEQGREPTQCSVTEESRICHRQYLREQMS
jgi:hypothetical protein